MGCNCGNKNKQQKLQQQVNAVKQNQTLAKSSTTTPGGMPTSEYMKAVNKLKSK